MLTHREFIRVPFEFIVIMIATELEVTQVRHSVHPE